LLLSKIDDVAFTFIIYQDKLLEVFNSFHPRLQFIKISGNTKLSKFK